MELTRKEIQAKIEETLSKELSTKFIESAYRNISFSEEKRAVLERKAFESNVLNMFDTHSQKVTKDTKQAFKDFFNQFYVGYAKRYVSRLNSLSNCFSTMITGSANVNVRKHEKTMNAERKKSEDQYSYYEWADKKLTKLLKPKEKSTKEQLEEAELYHSLSLKLNKLGRKKIERKEMLEEALKIIREVNYKDEVELLKSFIWNLDNKYTFFTTNSNAKVKRLKAKLAKEEKFAEKENETIKCDGYHIVTNYGVSRYQVFFDEKPNDEQRKVLKGCGMRWSPKVGAWLQYLTTNGRTKIQRMRRELLELG